MQCGAIFSDIISFILACIVLSLFTMVLHSYRRFFFCFLGCPTFPATGRFEEPPFLVSSQIIFGFLSLRCLERAQKLVCLKMHEVMCRVHSIKCRESPHGSGYLKLYLSCLHCKSYGNEKNRTERQEKKFPRKSF